MLLDLIGEMDRPLSHILKARPGLLSRVHGDSRIYLLLVIGEVPVSLLQARLSF